MNAVIDLVREDLRGFAGYKSARTETANGDVWLNANEAAWCNPADEGDRNRRYPEPQPQPLRERLADLYGCDPAQLLIGRGSDEAIDLLVRALCAPGRDAVLVTPPVFGMYAVCTRLQNARLIEMPLVDGDGGLQVDLDAVARTATDPDTATKLVFLCSPSNPSGSSIALADIAALAQRLLGTALLVVDEAYGEYSNVASAVTLLDQHPNIAVLRTLSKAHALAAARIGSVIADTGLIEVLRCCQAPYPVPTPCSELAIAGLTDAALGQTRARVAQVIEERERVRQALESTPGVIRVYASQGNYLLVRFADARLAYRSLLDAGVVVRDQRGAPQLADALRITIGTPEENDRMLAGLATKETAQ